MFGTTKKHPMKCTEHEMTSVIKPRSDEQRESASLDRRYGKIGISAVAAALPYQSDAKNPAYAPVVWQTEKWLAEVMA
jgi:hypothetical protein